VNRGYPTHKTRMLMTGVVLMQSLPASSELAALGLPRRTLVLPALPYSVQSARGPADMAAQTQAIRL
jgi:hypothetical protein